MGLAVGHGVAGNDVRASVYTAASLILITIFEWREG